MDTGDYCTPIVPATLTSPINALDYNMYHKYRGICLIIDNETFRQQGTTRNLSKRNGSEVDSKALIELFERLGFEVWHHKDLTASKIKELLKSISNCDHSNSDAFACIVLTHGDHGNLYAHDQRYPIDMLFQYFLGDRCPTLVGKPKLFFIQACQGNRLDRGVLVSTDALDSATYFKIPTYADFLVAYSTIPGFYSFRNTEKGSWFIRALVQVLDEYHMNYDLLTMMTMVCHRVAYNFCSNAADPAQSGMKQVPCINSMLTRRVFLQPKTMQL